MGPGLKAWWGTLYGARLQDLERDFNGARLQDVERDLRSGHPQTDIEFNRLRACRPTACRPTERICKRTGRAPKHGHVN
jgi:hypothetical protein